MFTYLPFLFSLFCSLFIYKLSWESHFIGMDRKEKPFSEQSPFVSSSDPQQPKEQLHVAQVALC